MKSPAFSIAAGAGCIVATCSFVYAAEDFHADAVEILENLRNFDSVYESGFTVSGIWQSNDAILLGFMSLDAKRRWRFTLGGDRIAYLLEMIEYETPQYKQPPKQRFNREQAKLPGQEAVATEDTLRITVRTKQWGYWGSDLSGNNYEDTVVTVTPEGKVSETEKMCNSSVFGPNAQDAIAKPTTVLWSLGRFYSQHLGEVTKVERHANGHLSVSAVGKKTERRNGRWELEIEPSAAWMVRRARFYGDAMPERVNMEMENEGTVWSGSFCIPKEAVINYWGPIRNDTKGTELAALDRLIGPERLVFTPVVSDFDEQLYRNAETAVAHNQTPTFTLLDHRVTPTLVLEPNRPKRTRPLPEAPTNSRKLILAVNIVVVLGLVAVFVLRRYGRRHRNVPGK